MTLDKVLEVDMVGMVDMLGMLGRKFSESWVQPKAQPVMYMYMHVYDNDRVSEQGVCLFSHYTLALRFCAFVVCLPLTWGSATLLCYSLLFFLRKSSIGRTRWTDTQRR